MPTTLLSIDSSALSVRFKQPFLSEALNVKLLTNPPGIYRGFRLGTSGSALSVVVSADAVAGDSLAIYQDSNGRSISVRTVGSETLDLSGYASKTVVIALFAQYSTSSATSAIFRAYEFDPSDEYTGATEFDELLVLGTVVVPASGTIAATSITNRYRTYAGDAIHPQGGPRVPVIADPYFSLGPVANYTMSSATSIAFPLDGWAALPPGSASDTIVSVAASASKPGGRVVELKTDASPSTSTALLRLRADIGVECGKLSTQDDWCDVEVEYEVVTIPTGTASLLLFFDAPEVGAQTKTISLPVTSLGVKTVTSTFKVSSLSFDASDLVYLVHAQINADFTSTAGSTTYLRLRRAQVTLPNTRTTGGEFSSDPRSLRRLSHVGARILRLHSTAQEWGTTPWGAGSPALYAQQDTTYNVPAVMVGGADGLHTAGNQALRVAGRIEAGMGGTTQNVFDAPRFSAGINNTGTSYTLAYEASAGSGIKWQVWADVTAVYIAVNAQAVSSGTSWAKHTNGTAASAIKLTPAGIRFVHVASGTNTWADGAWIDSGDAFTLDALTGTWADTTTVSATTLWAMLNEIVTALGATSGTTGGTKIGVAIAQTWANGDTVAATNVDAAFEEIVLDLRGSSGAARVGAAIAATWADGSTIAGTNVDAVLEEIVGELANTANTTAGANRIGVDDNAFSDDVLTAAGGGGIVTPSTTLHTVLQSINDRLVARRSFTATVTSEANNAGGSSGGGDFSGVNAIDVVTGATFNGGTYHVRRGIHSLTAGPITTQPWVLGEHFKSSLQVHISTDGVSTGSNQIGGRWQNITFILGAPGDFTWRNQTGDTWELDNCTVPAGAVLVQGPVRFDRVETDSASGSTTTGAGVRFATNARGHITNCKFYAHAAGDAAVSLLSTSDLVFDNCDFIGGNAAKALSVAGTTTHRVTFRNCRFTGGGSTTFADWAVSVSGSTGIVFENCSLIVATGRALNVSCGATFRDCYIEGGSNAAGITDPQLVVAGSDVANFPTVFERVTIQAGTASVAVAGTANNPWAIFGGVSAAASSSYVFYRLKEVTFIVPTGATGLRRGTNIAFNGPSGATVNYGGRANYVEDCTLDCGGKALTGTVGTYTTDFGAVASVVVFNGDGDVGGFDSGNPNLIVKNFRVTRYQGPTTDVACAVVTGVQSRIDGLQVHGNDSATATTNHTLPLFVFHACEVSDFKLVGGLDNFKASGTYVIRGTTQSSITRSWAVFDATVAPTTGYIFWHGSVRNSYFKIDPAPVTVVPLLLLSGTAGEASCEGCTLIRATAAHNTTPVITSQATFDCLYARVVGNFVQAHSGTSITIVKLDVATSDYNVITGNVFRSTDGGTPTAAGGGLGVIANNVNAPA